MPRKHCGNVDIDLIIDSDSFVYDFKLIKSMGCFKTLSKSKRKSFSAMHIWYHGMSCFRNTTSFVLKTKQNISEHLLLYVACLVLYKKRCLYMTLWLVLV